ncbi:HAD-IC family P-type ATPase [Mesorhizobium sp.]|uniref:HAD-IC family P-type ATPase n=1 Tax=Mesorhizobium sp. TaxID=1871066 RepID=UPI00338F7A4C
MALSGLMVGITGWASGAGWHPWPWAVATALVLAALAVEIVRSLSRGEVGLDLVAALSMSAALAFGEMLAGNVVALMYAGGQFLEGYAAGRARREMTALLGRVAHSAMRYGNDGLDEVLIQAIVPGDRLLVRCGEVIPVDGSLASPSAVLDESALTGESLPRTKLLGDEVLSGATNAGDAFDLLADRPAAESTYANIVRLVTKAQEGKPPSVRAADRYAVWFLLLTVSAAGTAWAISGDPVRVLAVLVVATPCPLILALPVAIISGMSRAAKLGVLVKDGGLSRPLRRSRRLSSTKPEP